MGSVTGGRNIYRKSWSGTLSFDSAVQRFNLESRNRPGLYVFRNTAPGNGIVDLINPAQKRSLKSNQVRFQQMLTHLPQVDPGVLAIDGFLNEEEESRILDSLGEAFDNSDETDEGSPDSPIKNALATSLHIPYVTSLPDLLN